MRTEVVEIVVAEVDVEMDAVELVETTMVDVVEVVGVLAVAEELADEVVEGVELDVDSVVVVVFVDSSTVTWMLSVTIWPYKLKVEVIVRTWPTAAPVTRYVTRIQPS